RHRAQGRTPVLERYAGDARPRLAARTVWRRISRAAPGRARAAGMNTPSPLALRRRPWRHFVAILAVLLALGAALAAAEWDFAALTDPERRAAAADRIGEWLVALASPDLSHEFLARAWELTLQTLAAAILGTALAVAVAYPLAMGASRAVCVGEEDARGV